MLFEALLYVTTPCPNHLRKMGYLKELIGIRARAARCQNAWRPHHDQCHRVIANWSETLAGRQQRVVVMGAALALDIPLKRLSMMFEEVVLVDLIHPWWRGFRASNVTHVTTDLTGALTETFHQRKPMPTHPPALPEADLYLSVNIASQLPCIVGEWLSDRGLDQADRETWSRAVIDGHFAWLQTLPGRVGLISEHRERVMSSGRITSESDPLYGATLPVAADHWTWDIAPVGEYYADKSIVLDIKAGLVKS